MLAKRALLNCVFVMALVLAGGCPDAMQMPDGGDGAGDGGTPTGAKVFSTSLAGDNEVPPVDVAATGTATLTLNADDTEVTLDISGTGFTVPVTAMHLHGGAVGENGGVILDLTATLVDSGDGNVTATGSVAISADVVASMRDGAVYLNMHTGDNPGGEIRGQLGPAS